MKEVTVVDARMGRGKSSAAIRYMNENREKERFIYITPFLSEVDRICTSCDFDQPSQEAPSKMIEFKRHIASGRNVATTHALFYLLDNEALQLIKNKKYTLIIDESINLVNIADASPCDVENIMNNYANEDGDLKVNWFDNEYTGIFNKYKAMAKSGFLYHVNKRFLKIVRPDILKVFNNIFMLTYLFDGQYQKAYLDYFGFAYNIIGVKEDDDGFYFSDRPDEPPYVKYDDLITIVTKERMNHIGLNRHSLSKNWYSKRGANNQDIKILRNNLHSFFRYADKDERLWTTFKNAKDKITNNGRYKHNFLQISSRATNDYRNKTYVAYLANRFADPNLKSFFRTKGIIINEDIFALSEMLQWIWRSAIRDGKPINLYIPSKRMRNLLLDWIDAQCWGDDEMEAEGREGDLAVSVDIINKTSCYYFDNNLDPYASNID